jgi:signal transduction histidine kinase
LTILDNGVGFDVDEAWGTGVGIGSMFERLQAAGGSLEVISGPETGTRLVAILPPLALQSGRTQLYVPEVQGLPA